MKQQPKIIVFLVALVGLIIITTYTYMNNNNSDSNKNNSSINDEKNIIKIIYNKDELGYNSAIWFSPISLIGPSNNTTYPIIENTSLYIYSYKAISFSNEEIKNLTNKYFPELDIDKMNISMNDTLSRLTPYYVIEDDNQTIHLLRNQGIVYKNKRYYSRIDDNIGSIENATSIALEFLKNHGGIPEDIDHIDAQPGWLFKEDGSIFYGHYYVKIYRRIENLSICGSLLNNYIGFDIDSYDEEIIEFSYHWPKLHPTILLDDLTSFSELLDEYGMNDTSHDRANITGFNLTYILPTSIQSQGYDASSDVYYIAPYWIVYCDDFKFYYIGMILPE